MTERGGTLILTLSRRPGKPWWWNDIDRDALGCRVDHEVVVLSGPRPSGPQSPGFFPMLYGCLAALWRARHQKYDYIVTFECDWTSFIVAAVQTLLFMRRPKHLILQFIMREKTPAVASRVKYALMRWCFRSVYLCVCSSRSEGEYYVGAFRWSPEKVSYVPLHTDPSFLKRPAAEEQPMVVAAGRTFRDYPTLLEAFRGTDLPLTIVASPSNLGGASVPANVQIKYDVPILELVDLIARSMIVVLPLEERQISIGQSVLMEAMTMRKPVVVTRVNGTVDYVEHMKTGLLVPPRDPVAIRDAVALLASDPELRARIGAAGYAQIMRRHLPRHYALGVARILRSR